MLEGHQEEVPSLRLLFLVDSLQEFQLEKESLEVLAAELHLLLKKEDVRRKEH